MCLVLAAQLRDNVFDKNRGTNGAGIWQNDCKSVLYVNNHFSSNVASVGSGGIEMNQGMVDVSGCTFSTGKGQKGGAIYMQVQYPASMLILLEKFPPDGMIWHCHNHMLLHMKQNK